MEDHITINAPVVVSRQILEDNLCAALEGGSTYWCEGILVKHYVHGSEWAHEHIARGGCWQLKVFEEDESKTCIGSDLRLREALTIMASQYPRHFGDLVGETADAETADVLFQLLCFKEVVYG